MLVERLTTQNSRVNKIMILKSCAQEENRANQVWILCMFSFFFILSEKLLLYNKKMDLLQNVIASSPILLFTSLQVRYRER